MRETATSLESNGLTTRESCPASIQLSPHGRSNIGIHSSGAGFASSVGRSRLPSFRTWWQRCPCISLLAMPTGHEPHVGAITGAFGCGRTVVLHVEVTGSHPGFFSADLLSSASRIHGNLPRAPMGSQFWFPAPRRIPRSQRFVLGRISESTMSTSQVGIPQNPVPTMSCGSAMASFVQGSALAGVEGYSATQPEGRAPRFRSAAPAKASIGPLEEFRATPKARAISVWNEQTIICIAQLIEREVRRG